MVPKLQKSSSATYPELKITRGQRVTRHLVMVIEAPRSWTKPDDRPPMCGAKF